MEKIPMEKIERLISFLTRKTYYVLKSEKREPRVLLLSKEEKEDITSTLWVHALEVMEDLVVDKERGGGISYLKEALVNKLYSELKKLSKQEPVLEYYMVNSNEEIDLDYILDVEKFMDSLPEWERVLLKETITGKTLGEIAKILGPVSKKVHTQTIRRSIRPKYRRFFREKNIFKD